jgi:pimeloyl-ACP methyl ester carboxylesterase
MSAIVIDNHVVHYEVFGRGRPVLFLHGWLGSWRYWLPTMQVTADHFRTYSFDFWGFGDSRHNGMQENVRTYSEQVIRFLDALGIEHVLLVGHSMGGMVAMKTALDYPERVGRVVTVGAPFVGDSISWLLKLTNMPLVANVFANWCWLRRSLFSFFVGQGQDASVQEIINDSVKSKGNTLHSTIRSMLRTDLRPELEKLQVPAMIIHGGRDDIVDAHQVDLFNHIPLAEIMLLPGSRHFPFLDEAEIFNYMLLHFLRQAPFHPRAASTHNATRKGAVEVTLPHASPQQHMLVL